MSRISRGYLPPGRNSPAGESPMPLALVRRGRGMAGEPAGGGNESLDPLSRTSRSSFITSSVETDVPNKLEKATIGSAKLGKSMDEFFSSEIGKNDYDWLLTPPGSPLFSSVTSSDRQLLSNVPRSRSNLRPASILKSSRSDNGSHVPRKPRSSSATRATISAAGRSPSSILNTSTASVNSRPSTANNRPRAPAAAGQGPTASSRSATPARTRPSTVLTPVGTRPSTPTARLDSFAVSSTSGSGPNSLSAHPTTPTRPSSPAPRAASAGRQRPGSTALTARTNSNVEGPAEGPPTSTRRPSSPAVRTIENPLKGRMKLAENQKPTVPEKKTVKPGAEGETGAFGRTTSKNSVNMALRHMDIRQGMSSMRGASLFPPSIRSAASPALKCRPASASTEKKNTIAANGGEDSWKNRDEEAKSLNWLHDIEEKTEDFPPLDRTFRT